MKEQKLAITNDTTVGNKRTIVLIILLILSLLAITLFSKIETPRLTVREAATVTLWSLSNLTLGDVFPVLVGEPYTDLRLDIMSLGYVDANGTFVSTETVEGGQTQGAFRIKVTNVGTEKSGVWKLSAEFPTQPPYTYMSEGYHPLAPHEEKIFILAFDNASDMRDKKIVMTLHTLAEENKRILNNTAEWDFSTVEED